ncbi:MAG: hybrid sensor histidine kinase/response regulator [Candidatus Delongbacteria bacterium]|nr:hybrid sensor histidine kinase/response regulator [Candidatus Delongbacteria bacterium]MBN2833824.1 hybrid sensor histidine kinase/response regulator [Candidatus Delongbacteria bacterium]
MERNRIVIVDDEESIVISIKALLRRQYEVVGFTDPRKAFEFISNNNIDVLITDEAMPYLRGTELVTKLHEINCDACKIIISGNTDKDHIIKILNSGIIYAFLFKPADSEQLMLTIEKGLELIKANREILKKNRMLIETNSNLETIVKRRTEALIQQEKYSEVGKFAASIVHNFRNPLQNLGMAAEMLEIKIGDCKMNADLSKWTEVIKDGVSNLESMVKSILSGVRTTDYDHELPFNINDILKQSLVFNEINSFFKHEVVRNVEYCDDLPLFVGHETHFIQVFDNMIKNSIDAMENSPRKTLSIKTSKEDNNIIITIKDTGCGINRDNLEKIFSSDFTTKPPGKGTGLGLSIAKQMIEAYGGSIDVHSVIDKGTEFIISLPLKDGVLNVQ